MSVRVASRLDSLALPPSVHGGFDYAELERLGLGPDDVLDFSVNSNPFGPPPDVWGIWAQVAVDRYPDRECLALRAALAERNSCPGGQWLVRADLVAGTGLSASG
jgi:histidinol-phosphate/aromatic aminotransferase/cobyric acid decarboxylase-like protein